VPDDKEIFKDVHYLDPRLEQAPPKTEPEPPVPPVEVETPTPVKQATKTVKKHAPAQPSRQPGSSKPSAAKTAKHVAQVLGALENLRPSGADPARTDLASLATSIAAVRAPGGTVGFKISGLIGKAGGGVRLAGGVAGGGGKDTRTGRQLLGGSGGGVGAITAREGTGYRVRGKVLKPPRRLIDSTGEGQLGLDAIQQVVNRHMQAIQHCYEAQLLREPNLSGKAVFDWTISSTGAVSSARLHSSTLGSDAVTSCILAQIRTWRFPPPVGGSVKVRYPFIFRSRTFR